MGADLGGIKANRGTEGPAASRETPEGFAGGIQSDGSHLEVISGKSDAARNIWLRLAWLPVPLLAGAIIALWAADLRTAYESPDLEIVLNFVFSVLVSLFIVVLISRSFLATGAPGLLMFGCGVISWGAAGFVGTIAGLLGDHASDFANIEVTIHNTSVWLSAACHLTGVGLLLRQRRPLRMAGLWLTAAYAAVMIVVGLITNYAITERLPTFFIQGQGGTLLRQFVLISAAGMFALTGVLLWSANHRVPSAFAYLYSLALTLITLGLFGLMIEPTDGCPLSWTSRAAQFLGGIYILAAAIASVRESHEWRLPLEELLYRQPAFVSELLRTVGALVVVLDRQGRIVSFNRACEEATGYSKVEVKGKYVWDFLLVPDEVGPVKAIFTQLQTGRFPNAHENYWLSRDGSRMLIHWINSCLTGTLGTVEYVVSTGIEVTDQRRAEEALRASEERFRALVQNSSDIITLFDEEGTVLYQSPSIERLLGYKPEDRKGRNVFNDPIVHTDDQATKRTFFERARNRHGTSVTAEFRLRHADGSWRDFEAVGQSFLYDPGIAGVVANYRDITERKLAEEALLKGEERYRLLAETMLQGVVHQNADGTIIAMNPAAESILGKTSAEFLGSSSVKEENHTVREDGSFFPGTEHPAMAALRSGKPVHGVVMGIFNPRRDERRWISIDAVPIFRQGEPMPVEVYTVFEDITDRKRAEEALRELNATLESKVTQRTEELKRRAWQLQKLTLELTETEERERKRLAGILHDDLQQVLVAATFYVELLNKRMKKDAESRENAGKIRDLLTDAIDKSRSLSHEISSPGLAQGDLDGAFKWLAQQMQEKHGFTIHMEIVDRLKVDSEPHRFLLYNAAQELLLNVIKHAGVRQAVLLLRKQRGKIQLTVSDRGRGFDTADLDQTLGLGLLSIRERVECVGGNLRIKSVPGKGSTFIITVPNAKNSPQKRPQVRL